MFYQNVITLDDALKNGTISPLETFPCPYNTAETESGVLRIVFPEFTCVCPKTGYPDFASIHLLYLPDQLCVELKSWKLFLNSFRMVGTFHEAATAFIFESVKKALSPKWALIAGDFFPRGNVDTTVLFETPTPRPRGADFLIKYLEPNCKGF